MNTIKQRIYIFYLIHIKFLPQHIKLCRDIRNEKKLRKYRSKMLLTLEDEIYSTEELKNIEDNEMVY